MSLIVKIPIKTVSESNLHEHWTKKHKRKKSQKNAIQLYLAPVVQSEMLPCIITLTRIAPRSLDRHDNLPMAFKTITDSICGLLIKNKAIGQADSDNRIQVKYEQIRGLPKEYAILVEILKNEKI
jgi:hypothetical protein